MDQAFGVHAWGPPLQRRAQLEFQLAPRHRLGDELFEIAPVADPAQHLVHIHAGHVEHHGDGFLHHSKRRLRKGGDVGIARGIHHHPRANRLPPRLVFDQHPHDPALFHNAPHDERMQEQLHLLLPQHLHQLVFHHLRVDGVHLQRDHLGARLLQGRVDSFCPKALANLAIDAVVQGRCGDDEASGDEAPEESVAFDQQNLHPNPRGADRGSHSGYPPAADQHVHL